MSNEKKSAKSYVQRFGKFLSGMVMPNIGAFIAWGLITAFFIPTGWVPNEKLATLVDPMIKYLLPLLIAYTGGKAIADLRGGVMGAIAAMGAIVGAEIPMFIGAMIMGPLAGYIIKKFDKAVDGKIPTGFEMLVNNFSIGILGMILAIFAYFGIGPFVSALTLILEKGVRIMVNAGLLPLVSIFVEPAKVLFLNNAINHGIFAPIGLLETKELGRSIMFLLEPNPGPGLGILLAYTILGKGSAKNSAPGAIIIHFFGGIHEIYFPYILMNPVLVLAAIAGGASGVFVFSLLGAGLPSTPSPGSIIALMALAQKGVHLPILAGVAVSTVVSFLVASPFVRRAAVQEGDIDSAKAKMASMKAESKGITTNADVEESTVTNQAEQTENNKEIKNIVFACDAGMGSSAMGASRFKNRVKNLNLDLNITNSSVDNIPEGTDVVVTHENLTERARSNKPDAEVISIKNFLSDPNIDELYNRLENAGKK